MDYLLTTIALLSLMVNGLMYKKLSVRQIILVAEPLTPRAEMISSNSQEDHVPDSVPTITFEPVVNTSMNQAWVNRTGIPLSEKVYSPALSGPPPPPGPLERPGGFV